MKKQASEPFHPSEINLYCFEAPSQLFARSKIEPWVQFQQFQVTENGHGRLQAEANMHHAAQATAAQEASAVKQARFEHDLHTKQLAQFRSALGDGLLFGMVQSPAARSCPLSSHRVER